MEEHIVERLHMLTNKIRNCKKKRVIYIVYKYNIVTYQTIAHANIIIAI